MTLVTYALIDYQTLKDYLGITDNSQQDFLIGLINRSTAMIEKYCQRRFKLTTYTEEEYDGTGTCYLNLKNYPIVSITSSQKNFGSVGDTDWDDLESQFFKALNDTGQIYYSAGFARRVRAYRFTYSAGYSEIPDDLQEACLQLCSYIYNAGKSKGLRSENLGEYSYTKETGIKNLITDLGLDFTLDQYRTIPV